MSFAARIESRFTMRTNGTGIQIFNDRQFMSAVPAQHRLFPKLRFVPDLHRMAGLFFMALKTRIIRIATCEFYGNDIPRRVVMLASCLLVNDITLHVFPMHLHT